MYNVLHAFIHSTMSNSSKIVVNRCTVILFFGHCPYKGELNPSSIFCVFFSPQKGLWSLRPLDPSARWAQIRTRSGEVPWRLKSCQGPSVYKGSNLRQTDLRNQWSSPLDGLILALVPTLDWPNRYLGDEALCALFCAAAAVKQ